MDDNIDGLFDAFAQKQPPAQKQSLLQKQGVSAVKNGSLKRSSNQEQGEENIEQTKKKVKVAEDELTAVIEKSDKINPVGNEEDSVPPEPAYNSEDELLKPFTKDTMEVEEVQILHEREEYENCQHEVFYPIDFKRKDRVKRAAAKQYKFQLDPFQRKAVDCLEREESVLIAAHTSAGKTAIAEYAIAMSRRENQKVIYTSPIKALSNQKFRELGEEFRDVGLVTGDVTQNQQAPILVMTTEILRSMLYKGSQIIREVAWVVFDEVHYMRDKERGVVWEETIILLNPNVRFVFLSATIPNASEFAEWICKIKRQPCHVIYTDYRPVPLQHYIFPSGGEGIFMVVDERGQFKEDNFRKALGVLGDHVDLVRPDKKRRKKPTEGADLFNILKMIMQKKFDPVIVFSFSKKEVEGYAMAMGKMDLTTPQEKEQITSTFDLAIAQLSEEDQKLPQIVNIRPVLRKGVGLHHGGLLPILKEVIEIMFQDGLIKVLFSTETFSMGLNMPARTVVFTSVRKFDGENFRWIQGGEYIQMSGRAGRRGLDDRGITILVVDEQMDQEVAKSMLKGHSDPLISTFHLNSNMLLNSIRMEDTDPEYIIRRSLRQFQNDKNLPQLQESFQKLKTKRDSLTIEGEKILEQLHNCDVELRKHADVIRRLTIQPRYVLPFLSIGRLVHVTKGGVDWGWGISINFQRKKGTVQQSRSAKRGAQQQQQRSSSTDEEIIVVDIMLFVKKREKNQEVQPARLDVDGVDPDGEMQVVPLLLDCLDEVGQVRLNLPSNLTTDDSKLQIQRTLVEIKRKFGASLPALDPVRDLKISNEHLDHALEQREETVQLRRELEASFPGDLEQEMRKYTQKIESTAQLRLLKQQIKDARKMVLRDDLKCRKRVLRRLGFLNQDDIVELKGKVACEISACDEILITELVFKGLFNDLEPAAVAGVLSALMHDENQGTEKVMLKEGMMSQVYAQIIEEAKRIFQVFQDCKMEIEEKDYLSAIKPHLIDVVFQWCKGSSFYEICKMCDVYEGSIIRCMRRLDELLKQLENAAKVIGNEDLATKFKDASTLLKRGIPFSASLYL